ncbi:MAG: TIGR00341 family protein, partial [Patescibacteria group bacterium]
MPNTKDTLQVSKTAQVRVIKELIESSRLTYDFYLMLILSTVVVTLGLLVENTAVIIGGMLITPLLTPILNLSLGIVIADKTVIGHSIRIILQSLGIVLSVSLIIAFLFPIDNINGEIYSRLVSNIPYFLIAFSAGLAATFAWSKKNLSAMLPGVAIAVSLLPPLSVVGIGLGTFSMSLIRGSLVSFLLNLFGIILGSVIIFSLLNFQKTKDETVKKVKQEIKQEEKKKEEKQEKELEEKVKKIIEEEKKIEKIKKDIE